MYNRPLIGLHSEFLRTEGIILCCQDRSLRGRIPPSFAHTMQNQTTGASCIGKSGREGVGDENGFLFFLICWSFHLCLLSTDQIPKEILFAFISRVLYHPPRPREKISPVGSLLVIKNKISLGSCASQLPSLVWCAKRTPGRAPPILRERTRARTARRPEPSPPERREEEQERREGET